MVEAELLMMEKDDAESPVPEEWRSTFRQIVHAFMEGDFELSSHSIDGVAPIPPATAKNIAANISTYGDTLALLHDETWDRSICRWMDGYWQVLVDLSTTGEAVSDLVLHARLYQAGGPRLEVGSVHVP